jgi:hypothetical protein
MTTHLKSQDGERIVTTSQQAAEINAAISFNSAIRAETDDENFLNTHRR